jgi:NAD(P)-dependent dehydrogenase (short-subunit alcohol dehydrogenase family)
MKGQTVLVTGGTSGIGFFTARSLAARGARVIVTGRDAGHGLRALDALRRIAGRSEVLFLDADHETVGGNQRLARRVRERFHRLDVLVNNVGGNPNPRPTADGYDRALALNAVGPFALTSALLPLLHAAGRSRVVNVVCFDHERWRGDPVEGGDARERRRAFARAKRLAVLWTLALARRPEGRGASVNAANPGPAWTRGARSLPWSIGRLVRGWSSPENAARASVLLAESPEMAGVNGEYFESGGRPGRLSPEVLDHGNQDRAWRLLCDLATHAPTALDPSLLAGDLDPSPRPFRRPASLCA